MPKKSRGFTLIELLVVISIIAVLSAVGLVSYNGIRGKAMGAKIKSDLNSIKKAYEANYDPTANGGQGGYKRLSADGITSTYFADGKLPKQPDGTPYTYAYGPDSSSIGSKTDGYKVSASAPLSDGTTPTVISNQGTAVDLASFTLPSSIPGLKLWIKADAITGLTDGQAVSQWNDSSGNNNNFTQAIPGYQPIYKTSGKNNLPTVSTNAFAGFMDNSNSSFGNFGNSTPFTMMAVVDFVTLDLVHSVRNLIIGHDSSLFPNRGYQWGIITGDSNFKLVFEGDNVTVDGVPGTANAAGSYVIFSISSTGSGDSTIFTQYKNGTLDATGYIGAGTEFTNASAKFELGGRNGGGFVSDMNISELIVYDSALSDTNRKAIEKYFSRKYAITLSN